MDRKELRTEILENLDDLGINFYSEEDVNESIKDGFDRLCVLSGCLTQATNLTVTGGPYFDFKTLVPNYLYPLGIYTYNQNIWLTPKDIKFLDQLRWDWELWNGSPGYFAPVDYRRLALVPFQSLDPQYLLLHYRASPYPLDDTSTFPIVEPLLNVLVHYSLGDLLEQAKEYQKAATQWTEFQSYLVQVKKSVKEQAALDKVRVLAPWQPLPLLP